MKAIDRAADAALAVSPEEVRSAITALMRFSIDTVYLHLTQVAVPTVVWAATKAEAEQRAATVVPASHHQPRVAAPAGRSCRVCTGRPGPPGV